MQNLVLDSSVLVAAVRADEEKHGDCLNLLGNKNEEEHHVERC